jgi:hypothetical protein
MEAPRRYSVSPLPSYCTVIRRSPSTMEMARAIWAWLRGKHALTARERFAEARLVDEIAEGIEAEETPPLTGEVLPVTTRRRRA